MSLGLSISDDMREQRHYGSHNDPIDHNAPKEAGMTVLELLTHLLYLGAKPDSKVRLLVAGEEVDAAQVCVIDKSFKGQYVVIRY